MSFYELKREVSINCMRKKNSNCLVIISRSEAAHPRLKRPKIVHNRPKLSYGRNVLKLGGKNPIFQHFESSHDM